MTDEQRIKSILKECENDYISYDNVHGDDVQGLRLIKEALGRQEPKKPTWEIVDLGIFGKTHSPYCGKCKAPLRYRYEYKEPIDIFCWKCGTKVDWNE